MLFNLNEVPVSSIWHPETYELIGRRLLSEEMHAITGALNRVLDQGEVHTSSWIPGANWEGTPFQPIYENAACNIFELAAKMFGLLLQAAVMKRLDAWMFIRVEGDERGLTYFRVPHLD